MHNAQKLAVYQAQVINVRAIESSIRHVRRSTNAALRTNDLPVASSFTKTYAVLFCSWAEANFSKVSHTPYGFDLDEIEQVQSKKSEGIRAAWKKAVELGIRHLDSKRGNFAPNARQRLERAIDAHVFEPSVLRNKLAHGQWMVALNRANDAVQSELTDLIRDLTVVQVDGWLACHQLLAGMVETLIESPKKVFVRDWYAAVVALDDAMARAEQRKLAEHVAKLQAKDARTDAKKKRHS